MLLSLAFSAASVFTAKYLVRAGQHWANQWVSLLTSAGPFVLIWFGVSRLRRKHGPRVLLDKSGLCKQCGYPLEHTDGTCPECGRAYLPEERIDDPLELEKMNHGGPEGSPERARKKAMERWARRSVRLLCVAVVLIALTPILLQTQFKHLSVQNSVLVTFGAMAVILVVALIACAIGYWRMERRLKSGTQPLDL